MNYELTLSGLDIKSPCWKLQVAGTNCLTQTIPRFKRATNKMHFGIYRETVHSDGSVCHVDSTPTFAFTHKYLGSLVNIFAS
jgi:hypothetical protein